jgi:sugar phosphate isomerase/epimerase
VARHAPDSLQLVLEIFDRDIDKRCLLGPASECAEFAAALRLDVPRFGLLADLSHLPLLNENPAQGLRPIASNLVHVHVGNAFLGDRADPAWGDQHPRFGYQGGRNDVDELSEFLRELFAIGYLKADGRGRRPVISFEVKPTAGEDAWAVIAGSKRTLALAWQQLNLP